MKPVITVSLMGRAGNTLFSWAYAKALAEQRGCEFQCDPWWGSQVFQLDDPPVRDHSLPRHTEFDLPATGGDFCIRSYCQSQPALIYSRADCRRWFRLRPTVQEVLSRASNGHRIPYVAHHRRGDLKGYGYVEVSRASYVRAAQLAGINPDLLHYFTEEEQVIHAGCEDFPWMVDFYQMTAADVLFRGNSSYSWWAATLGHASEVYAPVIDGLDGGVTAEVRFVRGNHPRLANLPFVTDLYLREL